MAGRLVSLGFDVRVYNRTARISKELLGAAACATPGECATGADVIVTMLTDGTAVADVLEGPSGVLAALTKQKRPLRPVVVDMSTIGRKAAIAIGKRVEEHGARFIDAPVSGTVAPAGTGDLVALVGGAVRSVERARPVLEALCKRIVHAGPMGQGQALKVVLNGIGAHHFVALATALVLAEKAGLARDIVLDAVTSGAFATPSYVGKRDKLLARDYTPDFALALALKDIALNVSLQHECGVKLPVVRAIASELEDAVARGFGDLDLFGIEKAYTT